MDVFSINKKEVEVLNYHDFLHMFNYAWNKFNLQRTDLMFGKGEKKDEVVVFDQSDFVMSKVKR